MQAWGARSTSNKLPPAGSCTAASKASSAACAACVRAFVVPGANCVAAHLCCQLAVARTPATQRCTPQHHTWCPRLQTTDSASQGCLQHNHTAIQTAQQHGVAAAALHRWLCGLAQPGGLDMWVLARRSAGETAPQLAVQVSPSSRSSASPYCWKEDCTVALKVAVVSPQCQYSTCTAGKET